MENKQQANIQWPDQLLREIAGLWSGDLVLLKPLYGDTDQNIQICFSDGRNCVLKITASGSVQAAAIIRLQVAALLHIQDKTAEPRCNVPIPASDGQYLHEVNDVAGGAHYAWMLSWLPGRVLAELGSYSDSLLHAIGRSMALIDRALLDFDHPAAHRHLSWDLANVLELRVWQHHINGETERKLAEAAFNILERDLLPQLQARPGAIIHNDGGNQHNMLLPADPNNNEKISCVIYFGDIVSTHRICELGIAAAYATFGCEDRVHALCATARGYHEVLPLDETDVRLMPLLILARYLMSVCHAAERANREPDNSYAQASAESAWQGLRFMVGQNLQQVSDRLAGQLCDE